MIPIRLELKNFLPYRAPDPVRFDGIHLACLTGPNGAGKSSLLDAITWALWGKARAKRDDELIHLGQGEMYVQLDFDQEGVLYRVVRRRAGGKRGTGTLDLYVLQEDNRPTLISEPSMNATQKKINHLLRLDYDTFVHSAFLQQGKADAFTTQPPAKRKQILADILGLEQWEKYEEATKEHLKKIEQEIAFCDLTIANIDTELKKEPGWRAEMADAQRLYDESQEILKVAEERLNEVAHAPGALRTAQEQLAGQQRRLREHERDLQTVAAEITRHEERIATYQQVIESREQIESGYAALQSAREADQTLGEKLRELSDVDKEYSQLERQLDAARAELDKERSGYLARIVELEQILQQNPADDLSRVQVEIAAFQELDTRRARTQDLLSGLGEERAGLEVTQKALTAEGKELGARLEQLTASDSPTCPLCGQPLTTEHRAELVQQLNNDIATMRASYRQNQERKAVIEADLKERKAAIAELDLELKKLPSLMERAGVLQEQIDRANTARTRLDGERAGLAEVQKMLDSESFGQDIRQQLAQLAERRDSLGYDRQSHDEARQQLTILRGYEARQMELKIALDSLPSVQTDLDNALARRERITKAADEDRAEITQSKADIETLTVLVEEQQRRQQEVNKQRTARERAFGRLVSAQQELNALDKQRARKIELETRRDEQRQQEGIYNDLKRAFGKNGIPAMIIESAIPELEVTANELLARMTDGRMNLRMTTQREKITGGVAETLDIDIADELGTRAYELYSGGEAFRINFAIRVALSQLLARRAGAQLRTLFIDEGFGTQDDDGRNKLVEAIVAIQDTFDLILVITHIDDLRDSFPVHIVVDKTPNGSRVVVR